MLANSLSPCITTTKVEESRDFYVKHFGAKITFDCGRYVNLEFGKGHLFGSWRLNPTKRSAIPLA